jgi:hypothetical protein
MEPIMAKTKPAMIASVLAFFGFFLREELT